MAEFEAEWLRHYAIPAGAIRELINTVRRQAKQLDIVAGILSVYGAECRHVRDPQPKADCLNCICRELLKAMAEVK